MAECEDERTAKGRWEPAPERVGAYERVLPWLLALMVGAVLVALIARPTLDAMFADSSLRSLPGVQSVSDKQIMVSDDATAAQIQAIVDAAGTRSVVSKNLTVYSDAPDPATAARWLVATRGLPLRGSLSKNLSIAFDDDLTPQRIQAFMHELPSLRTIPDHVDLSQRTARIWTDHTQTELDALIEATFRYSAEFRELNVYAVPVRRGDAVGVVMQGERRTNFEDALRDILTVDAVEWEESSITVDPDGPTPKTWKLSGGGYTDGALAAAAEVADEVTLAANLASASVSWDLVREQPGLIDALPSRVTQIELVMPGSGHTRAQVEREELRLGAQSPTVAFALAGAEIRAIADDWISLKVPKGAQSDAVADAILQLERPTTVSIGSVAARFTPGEQPVWLSQQRSGIIQQAVDAWGER